MPKIKVNDINLYYEIHGNGYPLIMILGIQADVGWWGRSLLQKISEKFKVIVYDNRGTGGSDSSNKDFDMIDLIHDAKELMDALDIKQAHIFGHSMGGLIASGLTINYPERVNKLILCSSSCGESKLIPAPSDVRDILQKPKDNLFPEQIAKDSLSIFYTPEFLKTHPKLIQLAIKNMTKTQISAKNYSLQLKAISNYDVCEKLKFIKKPTCIMHGLRDRLVLHENGKILANLIPKAKLILFENSAHVPFVEEREKFIEILLEFLN
ncbi:MAG: alpha/beta fold hydrolase [Promethearchaeota archaeon]